MSERTRREFRAALDAHLAALRAADAGPALTLRAAAAEDAAARTYAELRAAAQAHASGEGPVDPEPDPREPHRMRPARLVAEYERLRGDPSASRAEVTAAAEALASARQAHRAAAGHPLAGIQVGG